MSAADLAAHLYIEQNKMRAILSKYKDTFEKVGDLWQLKYNATAACPSHQIHEAQFIPSASHRLLS
jgi:hypothetical protein